MRILVATDQWFPDHKGGLARVASDTALRLAGRGHDVTVVAPASAGEPERTTEGLLTVLRVLRRGALPKTIGDTIGSRRAARALGSRFDLLVGHTSTAAVGLLAAGLDVPLAYVFHASAAREARAVRSRLSPPARFAGRLLEPALVQLERAAVRGAAGILCLSEFSRSLLTADHPRCAGRVELVSGAVDTAQFSPADGPAAARGRLGLRPEAPLLVSVRRLEPRMGLDRLIEAVGILREIRPVELAIVGGGSLERELRGQIERLGLGRSVRLVGRVSDFELPDWYRAGDVFVLPTTSYEGFGLVTAEALASGTPVVGTAVGATPELLRPLDERLVAASAEPEALARTVAAALDLVSPELRSDCRSYAERRFDWDDVIVGWEAALERAAASPSPRLDPRSLQAPA